MGSGEGATGRKVYPHRRAAVTPSEAHLLHRDRARIVGVDGSEGLTEDGVVE